MGGSWSWQKISLIVAALTALGVPTIGKASFDWLMWVNNEVKVTTAFRQQYYSDWKEEIAARHARNFCDEHPLTCIVVD